MSVHVAVHGSFQSTLGSSCSWAAARSHFENFAVLNGCRSAAVRAPILAVKGLASFHASGGSVERNDAASTGPLFRPQPQILLEEAVRLQMDALSCNDEPRPDHGLEVMYYFANTEGSASGDLLPSYFGFPSDLYHFGHFALKFKTRYPDLMNHVGYEVVQVEQSKKAGEACVYVTVKGRRAGADESDTYLFSMSRQSQGQQPPCWLTSSLLKCSGDNRGTHRG